MAWLLIVGTIPVGIVGLVFEHSLRTVFAKPTAAAIFLTINGLILFAGERLRRAPTTRALVAGHAHHDDAGHDVGRDLDTLELGKACSSAARRSSPSSPGSAARA